jgi:2-iminobutanoate/2-iminopropanoate deaminase
MLAPHPVISSEAPAAIGPYVHAVLHGDVLYCSGSLPIDPASGELDNADLAVETARSLANLEAVCSEAGTSLTNSLRMSIYTTRLDGFSEINEAYGSFFVSLSDTWVPARTTIGVGALPKGARVEIDAIVAVPARGAR